MKTHLNARIRILSTIALAACVLTAGTGRADEAPQPTSADTAHRGFFFGLNAGVGGSEFDYKDGTRHVFEEALSGGLGQLRVGYDLSSKVAVSLEAVGFDSKEKDADWELGAVLAAVTWRPCGSRLFLRGGVGVGGGELTHPDTAAQLSVDGRAAWLFGIGYEWKLGEHAGLGLAADGIGIDANGATGYEDDHVGAGGLTVQFNWYL